MANLNALLQPSFKIKKAIDLSSLYSEMGVDISKRAPYEIEVVIGLSESSFKDLSEIDSYPNSFIDLLIAFLLVEQAISKVPITKYLALINKDSSN